MNRIFVKTRIVAIGILALVATISQAEPASKIPWDLARLAEIPKTYDAPGFSAKGVRALYYDGLPYKGNPTRVFAWYGSPPAKAGQKYPAMVLIHGGGGTAFDAWVRLWNERGYAAIAMDTCGCTPGGENGKHPRHEWGGPPGWGGFDRIDDPVEDQWTYHAVADAVLAHTLIRSFPEVDPERIGVTGISWGGYLTCIVAGVDARFKCACPVYGCGFLGEDSAWLDAFKGMGAEKSAKWLALWDPSVYLPRVTMPMLWVTGTNDFAYPMDSLQKSYRLPATPRMLCLRIRMPHGHGGAGENPEEIHAFADCYLKSGTPLAKITAQGREQDRAWAAFDAKTPIVRAELNYTKTAGRWQDRNWESIPATLDASHARVEAQIPEGATVYYFNLVEAHDLVASSEHVMCAP